MDPIQLHTLSEEDIKFQFITPAIERAGWQKAQIRMEYCFTDGRIISVGSEYERASKKKADYILKLNNDNILAVVEAKAATKDLTTGLQQAIGYAEALDVPFAYASNGLAFREHDMITGMERDFPMDEFPKCEMLKCKWMLEKRMTKKQEEALDIPYHYSKGAHEPRYYQRIAINRTLDAIARGDKRLLLVMATGTGKTFTAFQIIWRLREAQLAHHILYLADRNILIDQTMQQDFKPFQKIMTKVAGKELDSSYELHMALYQQLVSYEDDKEQPYLQFDPNFFDLIIIDECHRGSAKENSAWRKVLEYFSSATQIGLTATPKRKEDADNFDYFNEPIYTYSLKQGIEDGFLAPYRVSRVHLDVDVNGYVVKLGEKDTKGNEVPVRVYERPDFGRKLYINQRQVAVAIEIQEKLKDLGEYTKTIVFCPDQEEAAKMRDMLAVLFRDKVAKSANYVMRITSEDKDGKKMLDRFIDPEQKYPVIVTTSELLSTGVDCKTCGLIVIDKEVNSMTLFKQMIGRGTRIYIDRERKINKWHFDILDFRDATRLFFDPEFDGEPELDADRSRRTSKDSNRQPKQNKKIEIAGEEIDEEKFQKIHIEGSKRVAKLNEIYYVISDDGQALEISDFLDYTRKGILRRFPKFADFARLWTDTDRKSTIIDDFKDHDILIEEVRRTNPNLANADVFDIICHVAYDMKPLTRQERANNVKKRNYFGEYGEQARAIIEALLDKYAELGVRSLEDPQMLRLQPFAQYGTPVKIASFFGGLQGYQTAIHKLEQQLYSA
ncbi:MAG: DEAD/DEAH box helicase family protein [Paludibacteraceae bacterium]|nr:DEAD/DEAH box helicase family protein [Paludibacteraceae bacterium]MBO4665986.1 DEAD/DEAH box helicase family protein [Paludibacteraceae bacterium]